jgi:hypothetical protein
MGSLFDIFVLQLMQPAGWPAGLMSFAWLLVGGQSWEWRRKNGILQSVIRS